MATRKPFDPDALARLAAAWLRELRGEVNDRRAGTAVVMMNFTAPPEQQWAFILTSVAQTTTDDELAHVAAGPIEHLLGWHGEAFVDRVEAEAATNPRFARALTGVCKYLIPDAVWARVQALQARVPDPLERRQAAGE